MIQKRSIRAVKSPLVAVALGTSLISLYLSPLLWSGWTGPDVYRAQYIALPAWLHTDWLDAVRRTTDEGGRSPILWFVRALPNIFWFTGPSLVFSKTVGFALIVANAATFLGLVSRLTRSSQMLALCVAGFVISLEIRLTNDAVLGGAISTPWSVELLLLATVTFVLANDGPSTVWFAACVVITLAAIVTDPVNTVVVLVFIGLARAGRADDRSRRLRVLGLISVALVTRLALAATSSDSTRAGPIVRRFTEAISSPIPVFYRASGHVVTTTVSFALHDDRFTFIPTIDTTGWLVAIAVGGTTFIAVVGSRHYVERFDALLWSGAALWAGAAFFGRPTSYLGSFGFALVFAYTIRLLGSVFGSANRSLLAAVAAFAAFWVVYGNDRILHDAVEVTRVEDRVRVLFAEALGSDALRDVRDGDTVAIDAIPYPFSFSAGIDDAGVLVLRYSDRRVRAVAARGAQPHRETLIFVRKDSSEMLIAGRGDSDRKLAEATIFRMYPDPAVRSAITEAVALRAYGLERSFRFVGSRLSLEHVVRRCGPESVDDVDAADSIRIRYGNGFFPPDSAQHRPFVGAMELPGIGSTQQPWRFAGERATFDVVRGQCPRSKAQLSFDVQTAAPATIDATVDGKTYYSAVSERRRSMSVPIDLDGRTFIPISLTTDGPPATDEAFQPRADALGSNVYRMLVINPHIRSTVQK